MSQKALPVLAHIHVPKTAGASFRRALDTAFSPDAHLHLYFDNNTEFVYENDELGRFLTVPSVQAFSSHFVRRFPLQLAQRSLYYVTFLRDPVQQFLSYLTYTKKYYEAIRDPVLKRHLPPDLPKLSLRECARWILTSGPDAALRNFNENYATNFFARYTVLETVGLTYADERYRAIRLEAACEVLSKFLFVGISERMDESWRLLRREAREVGIVLPALSITHENVSSEIRDDLSWIHADDSVGRQLLDSVVEDQQLYNWSVARFEDQLATRLAA